MAYYDPIKDKIYGCDKGTLTWYHEKCHQELASDEKMNSMKIAADYALVLSVFCVFINMWLLGFACISYVVALIMVEEIACWIHAVKNRNEDLRKASARKKPKKKIKLVRRKHGKK